MSTGPNRILDGFAKLMTDAAGAAQGVRAKWKPPSKGRPSVFATSMDLVSAKNSKPPATWR